MADVAGATAPPGAVREHYDVSNAFYAAVARTHDDVLLGNVGAAEPVRPRARRWTARSTSSPAGRSATGSGSSTSAAAGAEPAPTGGTARGDRRRRPHAQPGAARLRGGRPIPGVEVAVQDWHDHQPATPYDAITSYGAFEHFARDGSDRAERVAAYRQFFDRCFTWLAPGGRLALETIAHDAAPDTAAPLGRGPLGDFVLEIFPESICPHLCEIVLGFEP